ncbi:MAG: hypothetical protein JXB48_01150 [Candidatus Latescibacteria bacterium]|nr:hypothetical protein [Candidatus Latescibacterota bacterium]
MDTFTNPLFDYFQSITWEGPAIVVALFLVVFIILRQYNLIFIIIITLFFAALTKKLMIIDGKTVEPVISVSMVIYITGCGVILLLTLKKYLKF